jgi:hypothetical protein
MPATKNCRALGDLLLGLFLANEEKLFVGLLHVIVLASEFFEGPIIGGQVVQCLFGLHILRFQPLGFFLHHVELLVRFVDVDQVDVIEEQHPNKKHRAGDQVLIQQYAR